MMVRSNRIRFQNRHTLEKDKNRIDCGSEAVDAFTRDTGEMQVASFIYHADNVLFGLFGFALLFSGTIT